MSLWIKTQDGTALVKADDIRIYDNKMITFKRDGDFLCVGKYDSKERISEVLNEIQKIVNGKIVLNFNGRYKPEDMINKMKELGIVGLCTDVSFDIKKLGNDIVYEMPKE